MTITLDQILNYCNFLINKSQSADAISPDEFNSVLPIVNQEVFNKEIEKVIQAYGQPGFIDSYKNSYLRDVEGFISVEIGDSSYDLPSDYELFISGKISVDGKWKKLELINSIDAYDSVEGMGGANDENVKCWVSGTTLYFNGVVTGIEMIYVKRPINPFYDYCINAYSNLFLPIGSYVTYGSGVYTATVPGVTTYTNVTPGYQSWSPTVQYDSVTKEFVWNDKLITSIVNLIFEKMGINIREQIPIEMSQIKKKEQ